MSSRSWSSKESSKSALETEWEGSVFALEEAGKPLAAVGAEKAGDGARPGNLWQACKGLEILTTSMVGALDAAFLRG